MTTTRIPTARTGFWKRLGRDLKQNRFIYLMLVPVILYYVLFKYGPMSYVRIAFLDYNLFKGIAGSKFVGLANFEKFFQLRDCWRLIRNTLLLSVYSILFHFPVPILLALMINELKSSKGRRVVQTISYMPHFISLVVLCGLVRNFTSSTGIINQIISLFNPQWSSPNLLGSNAHFRSIYILSGIWQEAGWGSIIYLATLSGIDPQLYEAGYIDGASKLQRIWHITLPGLVPVITVQFIMRVGNIMTIGYEKILLLYNGSIYETADIISTYLYRQTLLNGKYSLGAAIGVFNSVINLIILGSVNTAFKKFTEESLW